MYKTFILVTQEAEKLGAKHLPIFFETPCTDSKLGILICFHFHPFERNLAFFYANMLLLMSVLGG